ncbi:MAG: ATP-binding protein [Thermoleophilia bacterium]
MIVLRSVKNWLTLVFLALVAVVALTSWLYVVPSLQQRLITQRLSDISKNTHVIGDTIGMWLYLDLGTLKVTDRSALVTETSLLETIYSARVVVVDAYTGQTIVDTHSGVTFNLGDYPMYHTAVVSGATAQGTVTIKGQDYAVTAVPITVSGIGPAPYEASAVVMITASLRDVRSTVVLVQHRILLATALTLLVGLFAGFLAAYFISRRLKRIERSAEAIAGGDLNTTVTVRVADEIGQLGLTFNTMGAHLRNAFGQIEREKAQVQILLDDLSEGVVGITGQGVVVISNPAAGELLSRQLPAGATLDEVFPEEVVSMWHDSRESGRDEEAVFEHGRRTLEAVTYPVGSGADFDSIIVLRDVSAQAKLERARRDFIANASHEFKTPLFSLSGFIELLEEAELSGDERDEFLQLMRQQVERLRDLSLSLLDLSTVESGSLVIHPEPTDLIDVAASVLDEFQVQAAARLLHLSIDHGTPPEIAWCDGQRVAQVVRALVDNAVKFTPDGGHIVVRVSGDADNGYIVVEDDGPGIPNRDVAKIFDRFYRGSDSRASKAGTGLGLSIARELAELMGGTLDVVSRAGHGARFTLRLRRAEPPRGKGDSARGSMIKKP